MRKRSPIVEHLATLINEAVADDTDPRMTDDDGPHGPPEPREFYPINYDGEDGTDPFFIPVPGAPGTGGGFIINPDYLEQPIIKPFRPGRNYIEGDHK
jgi:hypothetical protein